MDRRTFVKANCVGSASLFLDGIDPQAFGDVTLPEPPPIEVVHGAKPAKSPLGMPGLFPGRIVEVTDSRSIVRNRVSQPVVREMIERGMKELTGERSASAAWAKFLEPSDVVGIKINPSGAPACCSSPEIVREIINGVQSAGVPTEQHRRIRPLRIRNRYRQLPGAAAAGGSCGRDPGRFGRFRIRSRGLLPGNFLRRVVEPLVYGEDRVPQRH